MNVLYYILETIAMIILYYMIYNLIYKLLGASKLAKRIKLELNRGLLIHVLYSIYAAVQHTYIFNSSEFLNRFINPMDRLAIILSYMIYSGLIMPGFLVGLQNKGKDDYWT